MGWAMRLSIAGEGDVPPGLHVGVLKAVDDLEKGLVETLREGIVRGGKPHASTLAEQTVDLRCATSRSPPTAFHSC